MIDVIPESPPGPIASQDFTAFAAEVEPRLRRALAGAVGLDRVSDAVATALAYAWEHWEHVSTLSNPAGYLYRIGSRSMRVRRPTRIRYLVVEPARQPQVEPGLPAALQELSVRQRSVVWLVYACEWSYAEVAEALGISPSAVGTHASRGLAALRSTLGEDHG